MPSSVSANSGKDDPKVAMRKSVLDWLRICVQADLQVTPEVLWHYTTAEGLLGIVKSGKIRASQSVFLNDAQELTYGIDLFFEVLAAYDKGHLRTETAEWIDKWASGESGSVLRQWLQRNAVPFVACFCAEGDLLSQWRAYGETGGYALGFSCPPAQAWVQSAGHGLSLRRVVYERDDQESQIRAVVKALSELLDKAPQDGHTQTEFVRNLVDAIGLVGAYCKDPAFKEEHEWRIIYQRLEDPDPFDLQFRTSGNILVPYVELPLTVPVGNEAGTGRLPISHVRVGPNVDAALGQLGAGAVLREKGYEAVVSASGAPLRLR